MRALWWALLATVLQALAPAALAQAPVRDDRGVVVQLAQAPQRIVSLLPSLTESVCALGRCDRLVGVDRYSNWPPQVRSLPQLGGGIDPNVEAVLALKPDLVLVASSSQAAQRLAGLGLTVAVFEPQNHADLNRVLRALDPLLHTTQAPRLAHEMDQALMQAANGLPGYARGVRVYFEVNPGPWGAGPTSFIGETLSRLGAHNILPAALGPFPKINPEFVVRADPDVILVGAHQLQALSQRPGWARLRAVREGRVCAFSAEQADILVRPGPRLAQAAHLMGECLAHKAPAARSTRP